MRVRRMRFAIAMIVGCRKLRNAHHEQDAERDGCGF